MGRPQGLHILGPSGPNFQDQLNIIVSRSALPYQLSSETFFWPLERIPSGNRFSLLSLSVSLPSTLPHNVSSCFWSLDKFVSGSDLQPSQYLISPFEGAMTRHWLYGLAICETAGVGGLFSAT